VSGLKKVDKRKKFFKQIKVIAILLPPIIPYNNCISLIFQMEKGNITNNNSKLFPLLNSLFF
jgi:hypothetical protein